MRAAFGFSGFGFGGTAGIIPPPYNAAASSLFARMTAPPDSARKALISGLIVSLINAGIWPKLECFWVIAAHDAQAAQLNWISTSYTLVPTLSPTFTTDRGYAGDGSTSYLATGWTASAATLFTQDSAAMGIWLNAGTDTASATAVAMGNTNSIIIPRSGVDNIRGRINQAASTDGTGGAAPTRLGFTAISRTASNLVTAYRNTSAAGTWADASTARATDTLLLCGRNSAGVPSTTVNNRAAASFVSSGLTGAEITSLYNALNAYLVAVGGQ